MVLTFNFLRDVEDEIADMTGISIFLFAAALLTFFHESECGDCGRFNESRSIIGGEDTPAGNFPWMVSIFSIVNRIHFCGASLVTCRHALSAAHCFQSAICLLSPRACFLLLGGFDTSKDPTSSAKIRWVANVILHTRFDPLLLRNDIAVVYMDRPVTFSPSISPICLPPPGVSYVGQMAIAIGWGMYSLGNEQSEKLLQVNLPIVKPQSLCKWSIDNPAVSYGQICAGYFKKFKGACKGDSGGPLMVQGGDSSWVLVGITSYGPPGSFYGNVSSCGYYYPDVFTEVSYYLSWITPKIAYGCT